VSGAGDDDRTEAKGELGLGPAVGRTFEIVTDNSDETRTLLDCQCDLPHVVAAHALVIDPHRDARRSQTVVDLHGQRLLGPRVREQRPPTLVVVRVLVVAVRRVLLLLLAERGAEAGQRPAATAARGGGGSLSGGGAGRRRPVPELPEEAARRFAHLALELRRE